MTTIPQYSAITTTATDGSVSSSAPLHFDLNTNPDPVRISPSSGDPQRADIILVGSRRSATAIECRKIAVVVPTGTNSPDLTSDLTSVSAQISLPDWTPTTNTATKTITFTPASGHAEIGRDQGVTVQLMGMRINEVVGNAVLRIDIEWREAGYDDPWATDTTEFDIGKFPASFHVDNFIAEELVIDNRGSVKLNWEASGVSSLRLLYDVADINVMNMTTFTVNTVTHTTVFYLRATIQVGNNTVERILSTTVTVRVPDLEVGNLTVRGGLRAFGNLIMDLPRLIDPMASIGVDPEHPPENMLDGNLDTYYQSATDCVGQYGGTLYIDLGSVQVIDAIDIYFGRPDDSYVPDAFFVNGSIEGHNNPIRLVTSNSPEREVHWTGSVQMRHLTLNVRRNSAGGRVAIRSIQVGRPRLGVTQDAASFGVPVTAHRGIIEG